MVSVLDAKRLETEYLKQSSAGQYDFEGLQAVNAICSSLSGRLAPPADVVVRALCELFSETLDSWDEVIERGTTWPKLDSTVLEAVCFVARPSSLEEAVRIATAVRAAKLDWTGIP